MPKTEQGVVDAVEIWLNSNGFKVIKALPAGKRGYDIRAQNFQTGERWFIEAKGGAHDGSDTSNASWGRVGAAFEMAAGWRFEKGIEAERFAIAVPKSKWFDRHLDRIRPALRYLGISTFQVSDDGTVEFFDNPPSQVVPHAVTA